LKRIMPKVGDLGAKRDLEEKPFLKKGLSQRVPSKVE